MSEQFASQQIARQDFLCGNEVFLERETRQSVATAQKQMIEIQGIRKSFGKVEVLKGIDLSIRSGEIISVVGPSGAGKTTLLQILGTLERPDSVAVQKSTHWFCISISPIIARIYCARKCDDSRDDCQQTIFRIANAC